jgi:hypothetical protein
MVGCGRFSSLVLRPSRCVDPPPHLLSCPTRHWIVGSIFPPLDRPNGAVKSLGHDRLRDPSRRGSSRPLWSHGQVVRKQLRINKFLASNSKLSAGHHRKNIATQRRIVNVLTRHSVAIIISTTL